MVRVNVKHVVKQPIVGFQGDDEGHRRQLPHQRDAGDRAPGQDHQALHQAHHPD